MNVRSVNLGMASLKQLAADKMCNCGLLITGYMLSRKWNARAQTCVSNCI